MSKKSGFHRQIWPKSVTHLHGITHLDNLLFAGEGGASLKALDRSRAKEDKAWINRW